MSYAHCPTCGRAYDVRRSTCCRRDDDLDLRTAARRLARATPAEIAALEPAWKHALLAMLLAAEPTVEIDWSTPAANTAAPRTPRLVMRIDDTGPEPIAIHVSPRPARPSHALAARPPDARLRGAVAWGVGRARAFLARLR